VTFHRALGDGREEDPGSQAVTTWGHAGLVITL
jgi:hypothetical protein